MSRRNAMWAAALLGAMGWICVGPSGGRCLMVGTAQAQTSLIVDGGFEKDQTGKQLRSKEKQQGWFESRRDKSKGRKMLTLSKKPIAGNATHKAMIKASPVYNTYLSQAFAQPQDGSFSLKWDILVKKIFPQYNRSAFQMIGTDGVKGKGPNATGTERFVFLGFENAATKGKMNLVAFEGGPDGLKKRTMVVPDLDLGKWYTVRVDVNVAGGKYDVSVAGVNSQPVTVGAFAVKGKAIPKKLGYVSFASWNDGPGTFYVDNVGQP